MDDGVLSSCSSSPSSFSSSPPPFSSCSCSSFSSSTSCSSTSSPSLRPVRSISLPSRPIPGVCLENDLQMLRTWLQSTTATATAESLEVGLGLLSKLYRSVEEEVLHIPLTISRLRGGNKKLVDDLLEGYVRLLDACTVVKESLDLTKEQVQNLDSVLRRRGGGGGGGRANIKDINRDIDSYFRSRNCVKKMICKCVKDLRHDVGERWSLRLEVGIEPTTLIMLTKTMAEVMVVSASVLSCALEYFTSSRTGSKRWWCSLVHNHRLLRHHSRRKEQLITNFGVEESADQEKEVSSVDASIHALHNHLSSSSPNKIEGIKEARKSLEATEKRLESLESGLQNTFKGMIQNRLSLLNILY